MLRKAGESERERDRGRTKAAKGSTPSLREMSKFIKDRRLVVANDNDDDKENGSCRRRRRRNNRRSSRACVRSFECTFAFHETPFRFLSGREHGFTFIVEADRSISEFYGHFVLEVVTF